MKILKRRELSRAEEILEGFRERLYSLTDFIVDSLIFLLNFMLNIVLVFKVFIAYYVKHKVVCLAVEKDDLYYVVDDDILEVDINSGYCLQKKNGKWYKAEFTPLKKTIYSKIKGEWEKIYEERRSL